MPTYNYKCDTCDFEETIQQPMGSDKTHECPECGEGTCKRVLRNKNELASDCPTPGACVQRTQENRDADVVMTRIREKMGKGPKLDPKDAAADRHWGRKNGIVPGNRGD